MSTSAKEIIFEEEAREYLRKGIKQLADVAACTLGPKGRNVGLEKAWGAPSITNDGSSIVRDIELVNQYENMGVSMAKEVVEKIKEKCGDGTTTGTLLLNALVESGVKHITSGISPISLKRGIDKAVEAIIKELESQSVKIQGSEMIRNIATVSASGNKEIGDLITEAMDKVGESGVITIEEGKGTKTTIELVEGMQFDRGYLSPYFCTNNEKMVVELSNPKILLTDKKISNVHDILSTLQSAATSGQELLIIAEDIEGDALSTLVVNKLRGTLKVCAVKAPGFGDRRKAMLEDIAALTGGTVATEDTGANLKELPPEMLGSAEKIVVSKEATTIVNGSGDAASINARVKQIESEIEACTSQYDKEKLQERRAKLSGGVAVIQVGAATEPEMKQKKQMFEDSLNSTRAAQELGIVPGGGVALLRASLVAKLLNLSHEETAGVEVVIKACQALIKQIAVNAGHDGSVILTETLHTKDPNFGFNARTEKIENLMEAGVIDPVKVVITALIHASSAAGIVLISEALIADAPEDESE
ncbi:MAG: chaperonin GroEL [Chlamydiota bacterium]